MRRVGFHGTNDLDRWLFELCVEPKVKALSKWLIALDRNAKYRSMICNNI